MPRSLKKGPFVDKYLLKKMTVAAKEANPARRVVSTYSRRSMVIPDMVGLTFAVHNGRKFIPVFITEQMVGPQARRVLTHAHVPRSHRRAEEVSHAGKSTRSWAFRCRLARCGVVANIVRNKKVEEAVGLLDLMPKKAAGIISKAIKSAAANAEDKSGGDASVENLRIHYDRGRQRHHQQAVDAALDGSRESHQPPHEPPHGGRHGRQGIGNGSEDTSHRLSARHHQDLVVSLVRREELRQVAT
jgi:small subunit ribosomal protein S19